ncbi:MAG: PAS domain S-box protein [Desulfomonilia bacterium]
MRHTKPTKDQIMIELAEARQLISELKKSASDHRGIEEAIKGSEERYRNLVENAHDVLWVFDLNLGYTYVSPSVKGLRGYTVEEVMKQRLNQVLTPESYKKAVEMFERERNLEMSGQLHGSDWSLTIELELVCKDGTTVWAEVTMNPLHDNTGRIKGIMGITRDISERKRAEEHLKESDKRFRSLIQKSLDMIIVLDGKGFVTYETPSLENILGYQPGYLIGKSPFEFIHPDDLKRVADDLSEVYLKTNPGVPTEVRVRKADDTWVYLEAIGQNLLEDPAINGIVITARDITERKHKEEALKESEQRFSAIFENAADGILLADIETNKFYIGNRHICKALGYSADEIKNISVTDIHPTKDLPYVLDQFKKQALAH